MTSHLDRALDGVPAMLYISRANDAVATLAAWLPPIGLGPDAREEFAPDVREEFALEVVALMARLESLLCVLRQGGDQTSGPVA
jgi:hypothetical protein